MHMHIFSDIMSYVIWSKTTQTFVWSSNISMVLCKTAVTPFLTHWNYCSLALSHGYVLCVPWSMHTACCSFLMMLLSYRPKWITTMFTYPSGLLNLQWGPTSSEVIMKSVGNIDLHHQTTTNQNNSTHWCQENGYYFADDIFKCILLNENVWILIEMSLNCVSWGRIDNNPALAQIIAWRRTGDSISMSSRVWNHFEMHCICHI